MTILEHLPLLDEMGYTSKPRKHLQKASGLRQFVFHAAFDRGCMPLAEQRRSFRPSCLPCYAWKGRDLLGVETFTTLMQCL